MAKRPFNVTIGSALLAALVLAGCGSTPAGLGLASSVRPVANGASGVQAAVSSSAQASEDGFSPSLAGAQGYAAAAAGGAFSVITFNTAIGNPAITTPQAAFLQLPFYQRVITGAADAPILCLQEVGDEQHRALKKLADSKQFKMYVQGVGLRGRQNNMLVVPKRFQVLKFEDKIYKFEHLKAAAGQVKDYLKDKLDKDEDATYNWSQVSEPRGYQRARLKDTVTGKVFTIFNTHVSYYDPIRPAHVKQLMAAARAAEKDGPVIVAGDLNTRTPENDAVGRDAHVRTHFAGFADLGPVGVPPKKPNIDYVLAKGFTGVSARWYLGTDISLPGSPDALTVSDHYAEEDVVAFVP